MKNENKQQIDQIRASRFIREADSPSPSLRHYRFLDRSMGSYFLGIHILDTPSLKRRVVFLEVARN
ncbi:hypothetical protein [Cylindrospermum stagnale]|uniref:hypothetical protein n=1 Tax=Cylindrospermum stagnale TaxID=142864 RepID=UPI0002F351AC|nr:hypothetical protein [Cylindrospermum stagnale]